MITNRDRTDLTAMKKWSIMIGEDEGIVVVQLETLSFKKDSIELAYSHQEKKRL